MIGVLVVGVEHINSLDSSQASIPPMIAADLAGAVGNFPNPQTFVPNTSEVCLVSIHCDSLHMY